MMVKSPIDGIVSTLKLTVTGSPACEGLGDIEVISVLVWSLLASGLPSLMYRPRSVRENIEVIKHRIVVAIKPHR
jgi:hypothetical protein